MNKEDIIKGNTYRVISKSYGTATWDVLLRKIVRPIGVVTMIDSENHITLEFEASPNNIEKEKRFMFMPCDLVSLDENENWFLNMRKGGKQ